MDLPASRVGTGMDSRDLPTAGIRHGTENGTDAGTTILGDKIMYLDF